MFTSEGYDWTEAHSLSETFHKFKLYEMPGRFNDLPNELLVAIFEELELPWLLSVARSCKRFQRLVKNAEFGHRYLEKNIWNLSFDVRIPVYVGRMDEFDFGKTSDSLHILHTKVQGPSELHSIEISPLGVPSYKRSSLPEQTTCCRRRKKTHLESDPIASSENHRRQCQFCQAHKWDSFEYFIDKKYVVFLQSFTDQLEFKLQNGADITLRIMHDPLLSEDRLRWNSNDELNASTSIDIKRYGLLESLDKNRRLQVYFNLMSPSPDDLDFLFDKNPHFKQKATQYLYNPYQ
jgi:hypothetical protein